MMRMLRLSVAAIAMAVVAAAVLAPTPAAGDVESSALAKYDKPLDAAIDKALDYLAKHQAADGAFPTGNPSHANAVTGLGVMAFLAKGHTPGRGPYGEAMNKGIDYVLAHGHVSGLLHANPGDQAAMYTHGICTLMLSEVSGMVEPERQKKIDAVLPKAIKSILVAQAVRKPPTHQGGWRYYPTSGDSDLSCTGWQLMAIRSARNNGSPVPKEAVDQAVGYVLNSRTADGGFNYQPGGGASVACTGTALLCLELCGRHGEKAASDAGEYLLRTVRAGQWPQWFYYGLYYGAQGMFQLGDKYWEQYATAMYDMMLKMQQPDGSWPATGGEAGVGPCYSTAMGVLAMTVSYRQLPIYQR